MDQEQNRRARGRGVLGAALAAAVLCTSLQLWPTTAGATAVTAASSSGICPAPGQTDRFTDDNGTTHEASINCAAAYSLVGGTSPTTFNPSGNLTRAQAATILVNYVERSNGSPLSGVNAAAFSDTGANTHAASIAKASAHGLVNGFEDKTFRPNALITRAQFATIAVRATEQVLGRALAVDGIDDFDDDNGSVHEINIEKAFDNKILNGVAPRRFAPSANVTRGQAAAIVINAAANVLHPAGHFSAVQPFTAQVEWANDRTSAVITASHDLAWSRSWTCKAGTVQALEWNHHDASTRTVHYTGEGLVLVDFTYKGGPPVQADGKQQAWYSNLVAPGNAVEVGPYNIGAPC